MVIIHELGSEYLLSPRPSVATGGLMGITYYQQQGNANWSAPGCGLIVVRCSIMFYEFYYFIWIY